MNGITREKLIQILKQHGYKKYSDLGSHSRMYKPGDCTTAIHIPEGKTIQNRIIRKIEKKTGIKITDDHNEENNPSEELKKRILEKQQFLNDVCR